MGLNIRTALRGFFLVAASSVSGCGGADRMLPAGTRPAGTGGEAISELPAKVLNVSYGPHARQSLDFYPARVDGLAPLVLWIHGGGFVKGSKANIPRPLLEGALAAGYHVASIEYRLAQDAPWPGPFMDCARAVQFLRGRADVWHIDADHIAATGGSAGGGIALWLAFHADLADASSPDPVARHSTGLSCVATVNAQSSYDPHYIRTIIGGPAYRVQFLQTLFRATPEEFDRLENRRMFAAASPMTHATAAAPPVLLFYSHPNDPPLKVTVPGHGIHHPRFGEVLKEKLDGLGAECLFRGRDDYPDWADSRLWQLFTRDAMAFFGKRFTAADGSG